MKASEYRERTLEELKRMEVDLRQDVFNLVFQHAAGQLDNVAKMREAKRNLARVKTVITEHDRGIRKLSVTEKTGTVKPE